MNIFMSLILLILSIHVSPVNIAILQSFFINISFIFQSFLSFILFYSFFRGWSGGAKVLCTLHHWGVQLILAYSWARPAILVTGKGRGGMFLFLLFLHFHSCSAFFPVPLFHLFYYLFYLFLPFSGRRHKMTLKG